MARFQHRSRHLSGGVEGQDNLLRRLLLENERRKRKRVYASCALSMERSRW